MRKCRCGNTIKTLKTYKCTQCATEYERVRRAAIRATMITPEGFNPLMQRFIQGQAHA